MSKLRLPVNGWLSIKRVNKIFIIIVVAFKQSLLPVSSFGISPTFCTYPSEPGDGKGCRIPPVCSKFSSGETPVFIKML